MIKASFYMVGINQLRQAQSTHKGTKTTFPVGTSRQCATADQLNLTFLGGIGGEGVGSVFSHLPDGVTFRLPAGWGLMANAHYINTC